MRVIRTFYPVGQGAFYTEKTNIGGEEFTIVYDCGSTSLNRKELDKIIKSAFPKGAEIDLLFISDFQAEHINGLETLKRHCKIGIVVLPRLSEEEKIRIKISHYFKGLESKSDTSPYLPGEVLERLIDLPASFFEKRTRIIQIAPEEEWLPITKIYSYEEDETPPKKGRIIPLPENNEEADQLPSGSPIRQFPLVDWIFIPIYHEPEGLRKAFEEALKAEGLSLTAIKTIDKIVANEKKLKKVYDAIKEQVEGSMLLYSGVANAEEDSYILGAHRGHRPYRCFKDHKYYHQLKEREYKRYLADCENAPFLKDCEPQKYWYYECYRISVPSGCLYTGSTNLSKDGLVDKITRKLSAFGLALGTIQVPHRNLAENFTQSLSKMGALHCVIFSLDSKHVALHTAIKDMLLSGFQPCLVTEDPESIEVQYT